MQPHRILHLSFMHTIAHLIELCTSRHSPEWRVAHLSG